MCTVYKLSTLPLLEPLPPMKVEPSGVWVAHLQLASTGL